MELYKKPTTSKIYGWTKILVEKGYLTKTTRGFDAVLEPLMQELQTILKGQQSEFDKTEYKILTQLLKSQRFRNMFLLTFEKGEDKPSNAVYFVSMIFSTASMILSMKNYFRWPELSKEEFLDAAKNLDQSDLKGLWEKGRSSSPEKEQILKDAFNIVAKNTGANLSDIMSHETTGEFVNSGYWALFFLPNELLAKLSKLSPLGNTLSTAFTLALAVIRAAKLDTDAGKPPIDKGERKK
jgi:hypothetical protein